MPERVRLMRTLRVELDLAELNRAEAAARLDELAGLGQWSHGDAVEAELAEELAGDADHRVDLARGMLEVLDAGAELTAGDRQVLAELGLEAVA